MANDESESPKTKRFRIAFSFAGEKRDFVEKVAGILAKRFGEEKILYDKFHEAEFARDRLGRYLPKLYHDESELIVVVACKNYTQNEWCGLEWDAIFDLLKKRQEKEVMFCRFDYATIDGLYSDAGFSEFDSKTEEEAATVILERLGLNEGKSKDHYTKPLTATGETPRTSIPHNLPSLQPFFGREAELKKIAEALNPKFRGWGTLIDGDGGRGKTSLAVYAAYQVPPEHFKRIVFVSIKQQQQDDARIRNLVGFAFKSWMEMLGEIARIMDLKAVIQAPEEVRARILNQHLEGQRILFVLDNLETLTTPEQDQLFAFLDYLPAGNKALLTSRHFVGNTVQALELPKLDEPTALQLLQEVAAHNDSFATSSEAERKELICQTLGNALLLRWTAGQVGRGKCRNIGDALAHLRSCPKGNDPLEFIFGDILVTLDDSNISLLATLSHVSLPMQREDLLAISNVVEDEATVQLKELVNRALVTCDFKEMNFSLVPLVADFLRVKKPEAIQEAGNRLEKHAYALMIENGNERHDRYPVLDAAWSTIAAALPRFLAGENERLQTLCGALRIFLEFTGRWDEWLTFSRDAENRAATVLDFIQAGWRAYDAGYVFCLRGQSAEALLCADRAESYWQKVQAGPRERAYAIQLRGIGYEIAKDYPAASTAFRQAIELHRSLKDGNFDIAICLNNLADVERLFGNHDEAEKSYHEALRIACTINNHEGIATFTGNLVDLALIRKDWPGAETLAREALSLAEKVGRLELIADDSRRLAVALICQGKKTEALPHARRAVEIFKRLGLQDYNTVQRILAECES